MKLPPKPSPPPTASGTLYFSLDRNSLTNGRLHGLCKYRPGEWLNGRFIFPPCVGFRLYDTGCLVPLGDISNRADSDMRERGGGGGGSYSMN